MMYNFDSLIVFVLVLVNPGPTMSTQSVNIRMIVEKTGKTSQKQFWLIFYVLLIQFEG
jgi:hypothetical protein